MINNNLYSNSSLDTLLLQSSMNNLNTINSINNKLTAINNTLSYSSILEAMKKKVDSEDKKTLEELNALEKKYEEEMAPIRMFDLFHDMYISNGFFGNNSKSKLRNAKYSMWGNIFSLQAERVRAESQIAIKTALSQQLSKLK